MLINVTIGYIVFKEGVDNEQLLMGQQTTHDDGQNPITEGHLNDSGDKKTLLRYNREAFFNHKTDNKTLFKNKLLRTVFH